VIAGDVFGDNQRAPTAGYGQRPFDGAAARGVARSSCCQNLTQEQHVPTRKRLGPAAGVISMARSRWSLQPAELDGLLADGIRKAMRHS
jgi:hypothetical protein